MFAKNNSYKVASEPVRAFMRKLSHLEEKKRLYAISA
jgi:hypothetical protein